MSELKGTVATKGAVNGKIATVYGKDGDSAYEVAVANGFEGTEEEWLESLKIMPDVDQTYNSASDNPQSGIAISEAFTMAAINGTASGTEVCITDISPLEHNINVKVDNADTKVIRSGKNLYNQASYPIINEDGLEIRYIPSEDCICIHGERKTVKLEKNYAINPIIVGEYDASYALSVENLGGTITYKDNITSGRYSNVFLSTTESLEDTSLKPFLETSRMLQGTTVKTSGKLSDPEKYISYIRFYITPNIYFDNFKIRLQLEKGTTATDYEKYVAPTEHTPNADGNVLVPSAYPTTILTTDTEGVTIDAEYNVDTKAYIDNKFAELQALVLEG